MYLGKLVFLSSCSKDNSRRNYQEGTEDKLDNQKAFSKKEEFRNSAFNRTLNESQRSQ